MCVYTYINVCNKVKLKLYNDTIINLNFCLTVLFHDHVELSLQQPNK